MCNGMRATNAVCVHCMCAYIVCMYSVYTHTLTYMYICILYLPSTKVQQDIILLEVSLLRYEGTSDPWCAHHWLQNGGALVGCTTAEGIEGTDAQMYM